MKRKKKRNKILKILIPVKKQGFLFYGIIIDMKIKTKFKILTGLLLFISFSGVVVLIWQKQNHKVVWKIDKPVVYYSVLDGMPVSSTEKINSNVVAVMIDNHPDARPQSGLLASKLVYEAPAEGGITRYIAMFDSQQVVEKVGPVRSARPYFIDWVQEYDSLYMHCGGSPEALTILKEGKVADLNEMFNGQYFWRDSVRVAPHNLYTSSENWNKALTNKFSNKKNFETGWIFGENSTTSTEIVKKVAIEYAPDYIVGWQYDEGLKNYSRYINDVVVKEEKSILIADTVVIQYVKNQIVDDYGRREITTNGQGDLRLLRDGIMVRGFWKKDNGRTRFYDVGWHELNLKPGKTWIQIVPKEINIKIST